MPFAMLNVKNDLSGIKNNKKWLFGDGVIGTQKGCR